MKVKSEKDEEAEFEAFVSSAIRKPKEGIYEHLLSQFLASAVVVTDPLKRVKILSEAALMVPEVQRKGLGIDYELVEVLNSVANALLVPVVKKLHNGIEYVSIPWGFEKNEENFRKYIEPWLNCNFSYWPQLLRDHIETWTVWFCYECDSELFRTKTLRRKLKVKLPKKCPECGAKIEHYTDYYSRQIDVIVDDPFWSFFFEASGCLTVNGYRDLRNAFARWAIPKVQLFMAELSRVVRPELYSDILAIYTKKKGSFREKVKEISESAKQAAETVEFEGW